MVFFFLLPLWLLCVVAGTVLCWFKKSRLLSSYFFLCPTVGIVVAFVLSSLVLWAGPRMLGSADSWAKWALVTAYLLGTGLGGVIGGVVGFSAARRINRLLRWE
jgi:predicted MFS family arabinose efflux permease